MMILNTSGPVICTLLPAGLTTGCIDNCRICGLQGCHVNAQNLTDGVWIQAMQASNKMWLPALATLATFVANIFINLALISWKGFLGAAIAQSVSRVILFLILAGEALCPRP